MPRFIIERSVPGASDMTEDDLQGLAAKSNDVVDGLDVEYTWEHSYVAGDKLYCVHRTDDMESVREHARRGGFPADSITEISEEIGPATAG